MTSIFKLFLEMVFFILSQELLDKKDVRSGAKVADEKSPDKNATPAANTTVSSSLSERISHLEQKHRIADDTPPQATIPQGGMALAGRVLGVTVVSSAAFSVVPSETFSVLVTTSTTSMRSCESLLTKINTRGSGRVDS